jgi:hypothetical protein
MLLIVLMPSVALIFAVKAKPRNGKAAAALAA